jgi:hypothetical protein
LAKNSILDFVIDHATSRGDDTAALTKVDGKYQSVSGSSSFVRLEEEGYLTYQPRGRSRARLYARSDTTFYLLQGPWSLTFRTSEAGDSVGLWMNVDERAPDLEMERSAQKVGDSTPPPAVVAGNAGLSVAFAGFAEPIAWTVYAWGPVAWALLAAGALLGMVVLVRRLFRWRRRRSAQSA